MARLTKAQQKVIDWMVRGAELLASDEKHAWLRGGVNERGWLGFTPTIYDNTFRALLRHGFIMPFKTVGRHTFYTYTDKAIYQ